MGRSGLFGGMCVLKYALKRGMFTLHFFFFCFFLNVMFYDLYILINALDEYSVTNSVSNVTMGK